MGIPRTEYKSTKMNKADAVAFGVWIQSKAAGNSSPVK